MPLNASNNVLHNSRRMNVCAQFNLLHTQNDSNMLCTMKYSIHCTNKQSNLYCIKTQWRAPSGRQQTATSSATEMRHFHLKTCQISTTIFRWFYRVLCFCCAFRSNLTQNLSFSGHINFDPLQQFNGRTNTKPTCKNYLFVNFVWQIIYVDFFKSKKKKLRFFVVLFAKVNTVDT